jgi:hypothetical protein
MTDPGSLPGPPVTGTSEAAESGTAMFGVGVDAVNKDGKDRIFCLACLALPQPCHGLSTSLANRPE